MMRYLITILIIALGFYSCESGKSTVKGDNSTTIASNDTIRIANDSLEYEIIIIEPGFDSWIVSQPPMGHYGKLFSKGKTELLYMNTTIEFEIHSVIQLFYIRRK